MAETLILDPTSEDAANAQLDITGTGYGLLEHHYPQPPIAAQWASSVDTEGSRLASVKHENRQIQIALDVDGLTALRALQAKLGKLHREGGTFKRTLNDATVIVFDVLTVEGYDPEFSYSFDMATVTTVSFTLTCLPYGRGPEVDMGDNVEATLPWLRFTDTGVKGDMPALGRLVVDNDTANPQALMVWGLRSRYYSAASTAALTYQAESCARFATPVLAVGAAGASGAGSNVVRHGDIGGTPNSGWNGVVYLGASSTAQTHVGGYRVYARVYVPATNTGTVSVRLRWQPYVGSGIITNTAVPITYNGAPAEGWWLLIDLGMVSIPQATVGTQGWLGWVEGTSTVATDDLDVDYVMLVPTDEGYGVVTPGGRTILANGSVRVTDRDVLVSQAGGYWTKPLRYEGDYLRVPPAGAEARTTELIVKLIAGTDSAGLNSPVIYEPPVSGDPNIDDISARLFVTPRYLVVPSA